ncbi:TetR/AcrR family transcriptional regulator, partial [Lactiplantibacillus plantarum]|nr:TetR/AcrR family transcriptional regulator [Lactiplantibacillus plantarum]MBP5818570.1 TetR/AcrR family transcriptional regulator [Lactiplantibacillus plantarum]
IEREQAYLITVMTKILTPGEHDQITGQ